MEGQVYCMKLFSHTQDKVTTEYLAVGGEKDEKGFLHIIDVKREDPVFDKSQEKNREISCIEITIQDGSPNYLVLGTFQGTIQIY